MNRCGEELCPNWSGDGDVCPCAIDGGSCPVCVRCGGTLDHTTRECCSSHQMPLCHACYLRTHFVETCDCELCSEREEMCAPR